MFVRFACPNCGHKFKTDEALAGRRVKCPTCKHKIAVPKADLRPTVEQVVDSPAQATSAPTPVGDDAQPTNPHFPGEKLQRLFTTHAAFSAEKQATLNDFLEGANSCWKLAGNQHLLYFSFLNRKELHALSVQYLALLTAGDDKSSPPSWRWAWDADEYRYPADLLRAAQELRDLGHADDIAELSMARVPLGTVQYRPWFNWHYLAMIACGVAGADFYYKAPLGEGLAVVLLCEAPVLESRYPISFERMAFVLADTVNKFGRALTQQRSMALAYAQQRGCQILHETDQLLTIADRGGRRLAVRIDDAGHITMVEGEKSRASAGSAKPDGDLLDPGQATTGGSGQAPASAFPSVSLLPESTLDRRKANPEAEWVAAMDGATANPLVRQDILVEVVEDEEVIALSEAITEEIPQAIRLND